MRASNSIQTFPKKLSRDVMIPPLLSGLRPTSHSPSIHHSAERTSQSFSRLPLSNGLSNSTGDFARSMAFLVMSSSDKVSS